jgi:gluconolactonase
MKSTLTKNIAFSSFMLLLVMSLSQCTSSSLPEWQQKNKELIKQHNLTERELSGIPAASVESNLELGKVKRLDSIANATLHPGVTAKIFWGSGNLVSTLQLEPNAKIPDELLTADRLVFVLEGSIDQLINGTMQKMVGQKREEPDGVHSGTPRTDFLYLEKGSKNAVTAGTAGAKLLEVYSPLRIDYLAKSWFKESTCRNKRY